MSVITYPIEFWISFYRGKSFVVTIATWRLPIFIESKLFNPKDKFRAWCFDIAQIVDNNILSLDLK